MKFNPVLPLALAATLLASCDESSDELSTVYGTTAIYSPATGDIPIPNDLLYSGTTDATLNFPASEDPATQAVQNALGSLDGWSTSSPIQIPFSAALDPATLIPGDTVRFFEVTRLTSAALPVGGPVTGVIGELTGTTLVETEISSSSSVFVPQDPGANYVVTTNPSGTAIIVLPLRPLDGATTYMINVTDGITDLAGDPVMRSIVYQLAAVTDLEGGEENASLDGLRTVVQAMHAAASTQSIDPDDILISQQFTTQSIGSVLETVADIVGGGEQAIIDTLCGTLDCDDTTPGSFSTVSLGATWEFVGDTANLTGSPANLANVYKGSITLPYYLTTAVPGGVEDDDLSNDPAPLNVPMSSRYAFGTEDLDGDPLTDPTPARNLTAFNPLPGATEQETVPVLLTVPKAAPPLNGDGYPIVVFQHGITANRTVVLGIADALAQNGFASVSMDLPLHGITGPEDDLGSQLFTSYQDGVTRERTFGLDLADNTTEAPGPDETADRSGAHFINLTELRLSRDNIRQGAFDLIALFSVLDEIDFDNDGAPDLDAVALNGNIHFLGHSLGAIVGTIALTELPQVTSATLGMPGGQLAYLLSASESFGDVIEAGLAGASGLMPGTPEFAAFKAQFLFSAQTVADAADPLNYGGKLADLETPLHLIELVGETGINDPDEVIPNSVLEAEFPGLIAPLAGTEPLIRALDLASIQESTMAALGIRGVVRFTDGEHGSLLTSSTNPATPLEFLDVFDEMQAQTGEFLRTDGTMLTILNSDVVQTTP